MRGSMCESTQSVYNRDFSHGGEHFLMGQVLARILMWAIIIACVGYFAQQWRNSAPSEKEREAMLEAARSYHDYKAQLEQAEGRRESDVPQPQ